MSRSEIRIDQLTVKAFDVWDRGWFVLTAGDFAAGTFNAMTVSWGSFGTIWNRPFAQVAVRPIRHTYRFIEAHETFTLCSFPRRYRETLRFMGTASGRDGDKIHDAGLTPIASSRVAAPGFAEADLIVECRKIYSADIDPSRFLDPTIEECYPGRDYHRTYFGEVLAVWTETDHVA